MADEKFDIYSHQNGTIVYETHADSFDEALIRFFLVSPRWAKIVVRVPGAVCVKAFGSTDAVNALKEVNHCVSTELGGESHRHEVYWDVNGTQNHLLFEDLEHAIDHTDLVGTNWAHIIVRSKDNTCVKEFGAKDVLERLRAIAYC